MLGGHKLCLASMIDIPVDATVRPLLIESRSAPAYCYLIDDVEPVLRSRQTMISIYLSNKINKETHRKNKIGES